MHVLWWLIAAAAISGNSPTLVGINPLWTATGYDDEAESYTEQTVTVEAVEIAHDLPGGVRGWQYVGVIHTEEIARYDTGETTRTIWWGNEQGQSGVANGQSEAVSGILGGKPFRLLR
jgi:hypothetical protein